MASQAQVLRDLGSGWLQCQDQQGVFYFNQHTNQTSVEVPAGLYASQPMGLPTQSIVQPQYQQQYMQAAQQPQHQQQYMLAAQQPQHQQQYMLAPQQSQQPQAVVKLQLGDWLICEDAQGQFYQHAPSGQSFDQPPQQFLELYQAYEAQNRTPQYASPGMAYQQQPAYVQQQQFVATQHAQAQQQEALRQQQEQAYAWQLQEQQRTQALAASAGVPSAESMIYAMPSTVSSGVYGQQVASEPAAIMENPSASAVVAPAAASVSAGSKKSSKKNSAKKLSSKKEKKGCC